MNTIIEIRVKALQVQLADLYKAIEAEPKSELRDKMILKLGWISGELKTLTDLIDSMKGGLK